MTKYKSGQQEASFPSSDNRKIKKMASISLLITSVLMAITCCYATNKFSLKNAALEAHNALRDRHNVNPVRWDATLARHAQNWANQCYWGHSDVGVFFMKTANRVIDILCTCVGSSSIPRSLWRKHWVRPTLHFCCYQWMVQAGNWKLWFPGWRILEWWRSQAFHPSRLGGNNKNRMCWSLLWGYEWLLLRV